MGKHTPEPWVIDSRVGFGDRFYSDDETGSIIGECPEYRFAPRPAKERFANVRRLVACVNACRGLPTDELEQKGLVAAVGTQLLDLEKQRDELLDVQKDHHRLVRELDVLLNGVDGAAPQASLCDLVAQLKAKGGAA